jgi:hypothetical protein
LAYYAGNYKWIVDEVGIYGRSVDVASSVLMVVTQLTLIMSKMSDPSLMCHCSDFYFVMIHYAHMLHTP